MAGEIEELTRLWNPNKAFTVRLLDGINQPFVWGLWRGAIYLPGRIQTIQTDRQKAVVMHEMAHVIRWDSLLNLIQILIQGLFWFHPLVWLANRFIRQEREKCCDETAIARLNTQPKEYGSAIIETLVQEYHSAIPIPSLAVAGPIKNIEDRIKTIMQPGRRFFRRPSVVALLIIGALAAVIAPTTIALTQRDAKPIHRDGLYENAKGSKNYKIKVGPTKFEARTVVRWDRDGNPGVMNPAANILVNVPFKIPDFSSQSKWMDIAQIYLSPDQTKYDVIELRVFNHDTRQLLDNEDYPGIGYRIEDSVVSVYSTGKELPASLDIWMRVLHKPNDKEVYLVQPTVDSTADIDGNTLRILDIAKGQYNWTNGKRTKHHPQWDESVTSVALKFDKPGKNDYQICAVGKDGRRIVPDFPHFLRPSNGWQVIECAMPMDTIKCFELRPFESRDCFYFDDIKLAARSDNLVAVPPVRIPVGGAASQFQHQWNPFSSITLRTLPNTEITDIENSAQGLGVAYTTKESNKSLNTIVCLMSGFSIDKITLAAYDKDGNRLDILQKGAGRTCGNNTTCYYTQTQTAIEKIDTIDVYFEKISNPESLPSKINPVEPTPASPSNSQFSISNSQFVATLPNGVTEAVLLPEHFNAKTVLSLKTGQLISEKQAKESKEPYLSYGYTFPPGANPSKYTDRKVPEAYIGVLSGNMDLSAGGFSPESESLDYLWSIETIEQLPKFQPRVKITIGEHMSDGTFICPPSDKEWPYITAFKGDDGTYGVFEIERIYRDIKVRYKTLNPSKNEWGEPVMGLQTRLWSDKRAWPDNETPTLNFAARNIGKPERTIIDDETFISLVVTIDGQWRKELKQYVGNTDWGDLVTNERYDGQPIVLEGTWESIISQSRKSNPKPLQLTQGKHIVRLEIIAPHPVRSKPPLHIFSNPIEIEILPKQISTNSELQTNNYTATLPNGVTVKLLGICEHPSKGKPWWRPDGSLLEERPYDDCGCKADPHSGQSAYEIALNLEGPAAAVSDVHVGWRIPQATSSSTGNVTKDGASTLPTIWAMAFNCPSEMQTITPQVGVDFGPWKEVSTQLAQSSGVSSGSSVTWFTPTEKDGKAYIHLTYEKPENAIRMVAVDNDGTLHVAGTRTSRREDRIDIEAHFGIPLSQIAKFRLMERPIQWITFKNASLKPGQKTEVKIETTSFASFSLQQDENVNKRQGSVTYKFSGSDVIETETDGSKKILLLGPNGTGYFDRNAEIQIGDVIIKSDRRIEVLNTGSDVVEIKTNTSEKTLLLGPNGTGYFDRNAEIQIGDVMVKAGQRIEVINNGSGIIKILYYNDRQKHAEELRSDTFNSPDQQMDEIADRLPVGWKLDYYNGEGGWRSGMARNVTELRIIPTPLNEYDESWKKDKISFEVYSLSGKRIGGFYFRDETVEDRIVLVPDKYVLSYTRGSFDPKSNCTIPQDSMKFKVDLSRLGMYQLKFIPNLKDSSAALSDQYVSTTCYGKVIGVQDNQLDSVKVVAYEMFFNTAGGLDMRLIEETTAKADGTFSFKTRPSVEKSKSLGGIVVAQKKGFSVGWADWPLFGEQKVAIALEKPEKLAGRVVDLNGKGIADAEVRAVLFKKKTIKNEKINWLAGIRPLPWLTVKTDGQGQFELNNIPPDTKADLIVAAGGFSTIYTRKSENIAGYEGAMATAGQRDIRVELTTEGEIEGKVISGKNGQGVAGVELAVVPTFSPAFFERIVCISGEDGTISVSGLQNGEYAIRGDFPELHVNVKSGKKTDVKIEIPDELKKTAAEIPAPILAVGRSVVKTQTSGTNQPHIALETSIMFLSFPEAPAGWSDDNPRRIGKTVMANADSSILKKYLKPISLNQLGLDLTESQVSDADPNLFPMNSVPFSIVHNARQLTLPKVVALNGQLNSFVLPESLNTEPASGLMYSVEPVMDTQNNKINLKFCLRNFEKINSDKQAKPGTKSPDAPIFRIIEIPAYISVPIGKTGVLYGPVYTDKDSKTGKTIFVRTLLKITPTLIGPDEVGYYDKPQSDQKSY